MLWSISETVNARASKPMCHCVQHPFKLTCRDYWSSRNERNPLLQQNVFWRKCCGVSQKQWMLELSNLCHCVHHPENLLVEITGAPGTIEIHFLSWQHVLRKCCGVSQKQWMLELSNLCHCVQHPWKLNSRDYWSSRKEWQESTFTAKCVFGKNAVGYSQKW